MVDEILSERQNTHGDYAVQSNISQRFKAVLRDHDQHLTPQQREALEMILHKIARILAGDPNFQDHWIDIAGYATLGKGKYASNSNV